MYNRRFAILVLSLHLPLLGLCNLLNANAFLDESDVLFVRRIRPLLHEKCLACHGKDPTDIQGGLNMRSLESLLRGGDQEKPVVVPGRPEDSPIYLAVLRSHDEWQPMPPKEADKLNSEQTQWIKEWIAGGAHWPDRERAEAIATANADQWSKEDGILMPTVGALSAEWANRRYKPEGLWGYQPVQKPSIPQSIDQQPIDALIAMRMPKGLKLAPAAEARVFVRRATFD